MDERHDLVGLSRIVTQETADIGCQLGIPDRAVQRWVSARLRRDYERKRALECSMDKLNRSPLAQKSMGLLRPYSYIPENDKSRN